MKLVSVFFAFATLALLWLSVVPSSYAQNLTAEHSFGARAIPPNCVQTFTVPLRIRVCPANVGTATFTVQNNGRLQVRINLISGFTVDQARLQISTATPKPGTGTFNNRFTGNTFTTSFSVCGTTQNIALAVRVKVAGEDDDTFFAWAISAGTTLPCGVTFNSFPNGFTGYFRVTFCPCIPSCCNQDFVFKCPSCTAAPGLTCPDRGDLGPCPLSKNQANCYCGNAATTNPGGRVVTCLADRGTCAGAKTCTKNSDCTGQGEVCQLKSCCGGQNICVQLCEAKFPAADECLNPGLCR